MQNALIPVIIGIGEVADRPASLDLAREPIDLMVEALRRAERDAGAPLLTRLDGLEIINEVSWPYLDPCAELITKLASGSPECTYHPVGGQTPVLAIHRAALEIQEGRWQFAAICGAEAEGSVAGARKTGFELPWRPSIENFKPTRGADYQRPIARELDFATPAHVYPFYEYATRKAWNQSLETAATESATIWVNNAGVAHNRDAAWLKRNVGIGDITTVSADNRMIAWPYTKLMMANPRVNQGAAIIMCSLEKARELGIAEERIVYIRGGAAADERRDYLERETFSRSLAMEWVLNETGSLCNDKQISAVELYSCFPAVPKMARRILDLEMETPLSVAGGLTFFGAPLNNYMTHAAVAMVDRIRKTRANGLLYGQGEYVTKHHAVILSGDPPHEPLATDYRRREVAPPIETTGSYVGPTMGITATVLYDRDGSIRHGGVISRTPTGEHILARVPCTDEATLRAIMSEASIVGQIGVTQPSADGVVQWSASA